MGTRLRVTLAAPNRQDGIAAIETAFAEMRRLESLLSSWRDDTEIGRLRTAPADVPLSVSPETITLLEEVRVWSELTGAAFDPAIGPLIDAWDLRGSGKRPTPGELEDALARSGFDGFQLDGPGSRVLTRRQGDWISAGGFGKGAALRAAREALRAAGIESALLDFGGQLVAMGSDQRGSSDWTIGVANPASRDEEAFRLRLHGGRSAATSAAGERFIEIDGERFGHIVDPRTGWPVPAWGSVTVVHEDPLIADLVSTALFVMGPEAGMAWASGEAHVAALFLELEGERLAATWTPAMERWLLDAAGAPVTSTAAGGGQEDLERRMRALERQVDELGTRVAAQDSAALAEIRGQIDAITREIEELRLGQEVVVEAAGGQFGLGPAASKVYRVAQGVSIGGYGEMLYENFSGEREDGSASGATDQLDALRAIVYVGYKFNDRFLFNSELEFEHGTTDQAGSVSVEFAYLDWRIADAIGVRAGLLLIPMGFINELHEPPIFLGSERPQTEQQIIPSTWRENGIGIFGEAGGFTYRAYAVNGLDAVGGGTSKASGFSASGLRGGRQKGSKAMAEDFAFVGRLDYVGQLGVTVGYSVYVGNSGQNNASPLDPARSFDGTTIIWEGHAEYKAFGFDLRGLFALAHVSEAAEINEARGLTGSESVGKQLLGGYLQAGYDVLRGTRSQHQLLPYLRYERLNTQDQVPDGFAADPSNDREIISIGAAWRPITNIIAKADYQIHRNEASTGVNQLSATIGYLF